MFRAGCVCGDEGQVDLRSGHAGKLDFCLFGSFFQALHRHFVVAEVNALVLFEFVRHPIDDALVEVVAAQMVVAGGGQNFLHAFAHLDDGHIKGTAAQVVDHDFLVALFIHAIGQSRSCGLVDDAFNIQSGNFTGVFGGLTLCVGKICRNGDDRFGNFFTQITFRVGFQFLQDHC